MARRCNAARHVRRDETLLDGLHARVLAGGRARHDEQRFGADEKPFSAKNSCSDAENTKSIPQSEQVST